MERRSERPLLSHAPDASRRTVRPDGVAAGVARPDGHLLDRRRAAQASPPAVAMYDVGRPGAARGVIVGRSVPLVAPRRMGFGLPNLRRNVCPHFYMTGPRGAIPIQAPHLLKALSRQEQNISRCQLRGGVHLEQGYVADVCLSSRFNQCVFYEDELSRRTD